MKFPQLTHENFLMFAIKAYDNPLCSSSEEFKKDMKHFVYVLKLLNKMESGSFDDSKYRLMVNHVIILRNLFGNVPTARMLFFYYPERFHSVIAAILEFTQCLPPHVPETDLKRIRPCQKVMEALRRM